MFCFSQCAFWARYLRELVEGFGTRQRKGVQGVVGTFYRGVTKTFCFNETILRFNGPLSTTINQAAALKDIYVGKDGLMLTLKPDWAGHRGNIRAFNCAAVSPYPYEKEYLFIGGLEPLAIQDIYEVKGAVSHYDDVQTMNNIHQIMKGNACAAKMKPRLIQEFIDNRLREKNDANRDNGYMHRNFDFYCDAMTEIVIRLSLMDQSYQKV